MLALRPMLCFAVALMGGVVAGRRFPELCGWLPCAAALFLLLVIAFILSRRRETPPPPGNMPEAYVPHILARPGFIAGRGLNRFVLIACFGMFLLGVWREGMWRERLRPDRLPDRTWFDANLLALSPRREYDGEEGRWRVAALLLTADGKPVGEVPVRLSGRDGDDFRRGDLIRARVRRERIPPLAYPGAFDLGFWLERDGLAASLAVAAPRREYGEKAAYRVIPVEATPFFTWFRRGIDAVRAKAVALTLAYGKDEAAGLLAAMLYGYRKDVSAEVRDAFRRTGIGHVLAISGLHVGLVVGLFWWLTGLAGWPARRRAWCCIAVAVVYLGLSGGQVAAARATFMAVVHLAGVAWGRRTDMMNSLGLAAFVIILDNPSAPLDISFQFSFTAVVFIFFATRRRPDAWSRPAGSGKKRRAPASRFRARVMAEVRSLVLLSVYTWLGMFPIIAIVFNQLNLAGLPFNIVIIPLTSLVLVGGLLLPWLGWIPGMPWLLSLPANLMSWQALFVDSLPYSSVSCHAPATPWMIAFYVPFLLFSLEGLIPEGIFRRRWLVACCGMSALATVGLVASMRSAPPPAGGRLAVLSTRGVGMIAAESEEGGLALVGSLYRGGQAEAGWFHYLKRGGGVGVVMVGAEAPGDPASPPRTDPALSAFSYHYPIAAVSRLAGRADAKEPATFVSGWRAVDGAPGIEYAVSRDSSGRVAWLAVRTGKKSVCVAPRIAFRQFEWRRERRTIGFDADLTVAGFSDKAPPLPTVPPPGAVGVVGRFDGTLPGGWFDKDEYGVVRVDDGILGFDGREWIPLPRTVEK